MRVLIDMNLSPAWVAFLVRHGFESVHWSSVGEATSRDAEILGYAKREGFVVFTHDLDFGSLLAVSKATGPSVIQVRTQDTLPSAIGEVVMRAIQATNEQLAKGALVTVEPDRFRIRILPI
jgi:predicted nuclease of predicted toxin-antitoxin system